MPKEDCLSSAVRWAENSITNIYTSMSPPILLTSRLLPWTINSGESSRLRRRGATAEDEHERGAGPIAMEIRKLVAVLTANSPHEEA